MAAETREFAQDGPASSRLSEFQALVISGTSAPSSDGATFEVVNPMRGEKIYDSASATVEDYGRAIESAQAAFGSWSRTSPSARRLIFLKAADIIEECLQHGPDGETASILSAEVSATRSWVHVSLWGTAALLRESAGLVTHIKGEIVPSEKPGTTILVERQPVGVVFAISPWNAPMNLTARAIATPLICGNTVVLKPSEISPKSQYLVVRALAEAGLPPGCLNFLPTSADRAPAVTEYAVRHPLVKRVNFTGGDRVGRIIAGWAATCLKQCVLELGGKSPLLVLDDANVEDAVEAVVFGALANAGQICMSTERVLVHKSIAVGFKERLLQKIKTLKAGNHEEDPEVSISGLYTPASAARVLALMQGAVSSGAKLLCGDLSITGPNKTIIAPHVFEDVTPEMDIFHKESFGPLICLTEFETDDEAVRLANNSDFSLCASVFSRDIMRALDLARQVQAGSCHVNGPTVYIEPTLPNGGTGGSSGYGRFGGMAGVEEFTERQIISLGKSGVRYNF